MKQVKIAVRKKGSATTQNLSEADAEMKQLLERLEKKKLNPMQMCQKLIDHGVPHPSEENWTYDLVVRECERLKIKPLSEN